MRVISTANKIASCVECNPKYTHNVNVAVDTNNELAIAVDTGNELTIAVDTNNKLIITVDTDNKIANLLIV